MRSGQAIKPHRHALSTSRDDAKKQASFDFFTTVTSDGIQGQRKRVRFFISDVDVTYYQRKCQSAIFSPT